MIHTIGAALVPHYALFGRCLDAPALYRLFRPAIIGQGTAEVRYSLPKPPQQFPRDATHLKMTIKSRARGASPWLAMYAAILLLLTVFCPMRQYQVPLEIEW